MTDSIYNPEYVKGLFNRMSSSYERMNYITSFGFSIRWRTPFLEPFQSITDWKKYEIVLDVYAKATNIAYGALLSGTGQIWFANIKFEIVDNTVKTTDIKNNEPTNLNFEK